MMTVDELIDLTLVRIGREFYRGDVKSFMRDQTALSKAIARYGYECHSRGWDLDEATVFCEIGKVLDTVRLDGVKIWLPLYLEAAMDRSVRLRAEELSAQAKRVGPRVQRVLDRLNIQEVREPTACEVLGILYRELKKKRRRRQTKPESKQPRLL